MQANQVLFHRRNFNKNFVAIYEIKPVLTRDKPIYVGFNILDLRWLALLNQNYFFMD